MPSLHPHDVAIALQLALTSDAPYRAIADAVGLSQGEAHNAVKRLKESRLLRHDQRIVNAAALFDFIVSGVPYAFPAAPGPDTRGVPTGFSAPPLANEIVSESPVVWPSAEGKTRGAGVDPLYPKAPATAIHNLSLYELLALVDALRIGRARERHRARTKLQERLMGLTRRSTGR